MSDRSDCPGSGSFHRPVATFRLAFKGEVMSVRRALRDVSDWLGQQGIGPSHRGTVQIVMAEVLNNIVEHAYFGTGAGPIALLISDCSTGLAVRVSDKGGPMPGGRLPDGTTPDGNHPGAMNEGGYGWLLIRTLADDLHYERSGTCNKLSFLLPLRGDRRE